MLRLFQGDSHATADPRRAMTITHRVRQVGCNRWMCVREDSGPTSQAEAPYGRLSKWPFNPIGASQGLIMFSNAAAFSVILTQASRHAHDIRATPAPLSRLQYFRDI